jgi:hypothetical protein
VGWARKRKWATPVGEREERERERGLGQGERRLGKKGKIRSKEFIAKIK